MAECKHDWREFKIGDTELSVTWHLDTNSDSVKMAGIRQCALCYRLSLDLDYVAGEYFTLTISSEGTAPTIVPEP